MSEKSLYKRISADLNSLVEKGKLVPGEKVPSVGDLRDKYKVSHLTALKALKTLALEKFIEFEQGKGYFVCDRPGRHAAAGRPRTHGLVACLLRPSWETNERDNYFNDINQAVENELMSKAFSTLHPWCSQLLMNMFPSEETQEQIRRKILELDGTVDGFLLDERISDKVIDELSGKVSKPMVVVNRTTTAGADSVSPDNFGGGEKAAEMCLKLGYVKFLVGRNLQQTPNHTERTEGFLSGLKKGGVSADMIIEFGFNLREHEAEFGPYERHLEGAEKTLVFSPTDFFARWAADMLAARGVEFGKKIGVMGFESLLLASAKKPELATMDVGPSRIGATAVGVLLARINRTALNGPKNHFPEAVFKMGETI